MLKVEVVLATPEHVERAKLVLDEGATIGEALSRSCLWDEGLELSVGVFGHPKTLEDRLSDGDRVEIYRPLQADPKQARRNRAKLRRRPSQSTTPIS